MKTAIIKKKESPNFNINSYSKLFIVKVFQKYFIGDRKYFTKQFGQNRQTTLHRISKQTSIPRKGREVGRRCVEKEIVSVKKVVNL